MERWLPVPGFEPYYEVSDQGRVRSYRPRGAAARGGSASPVAEPRLLIPQVQRQTGYPYVLLQREKVGHNRLVHRLVLEAFVGPPPAKDMQACHNDGTRTNNRLENLRWDTRSGNMKDKILHGTNVSHTGLQTHCIRGHEFSEENTWFYRTKDGAPYRRCKKCNRRRVREWEERKRASALGTGASASRNGVASAG